MSKTTIPTDEIAFVDDKLNRKQIAENFKNILLNSNSNVFSISAPWGGGKTYFIENLIKMINNEAVCILHNAWESDFYNSPLIPLLIELLQKFEDISQDNKLEEDIKNSKNLAKQFCEKTSFQLGVNLGIVSLGANFDPSKKLTESEYIELKNLLNDFKNRIRNIQEKLNKKIFVFVDELDRCHPKYTIKMLEVIKHFFGIKNVIFILAVDKTQIENSVRTIYGINKGEENGYLRKFIDVDFSLSLTSLEDFTNFHFSQLKEKIEYFKERNKYYCYHNPTQNIDETIHLVNITTRLFHNADLQPRDIEKFFIRLGLTLDILKNNDVLFIEPVIAMNVLLIKDIKEFHRYINNEVNINGPDIIRTINSSILPTWEGVFRKNGYMEILRNYNNHDVVNPNTSMANVGDIDKNSNRVIFSGIEGTIENYMLNYPQKIEFINNFNTD